MRKIELEMLVAAKEGKNWSRGGTSVTRTAGGMEVALHGNVLGVYGDQGGGDYTFTVNTETLKKYPTNTTKSRLRAFCVNVWTAKGVTMLDGVPV